MAQLSDDCFAFGGPLMSLDAARGMLASRLVAVTEVERVALDAALDRVRALLRQARGTAAPDAPTSPVPVTVSTPVEAS